MIGLLIAFPAWAQDCPAIIADLKAKPPAGGDSARADAEWNTFLTSCERQPGDTFTAEQVWEISKVIHPNVMHSK
jgi:hypothetical protein